MQGEVIGVNSQIFSRTGGFMGLSFAIPVDMVRNVYEQIRETGQVDRGWLGVLIQDVTRELAESFGMDKPQGALVAKVLEDSPAAEAGIEAGDIILSFNGQDIDLSSDLPPVVGSTPINRSVPVDILRNGATRTLKVKIGPLPKEGEIQISSAGSPESNLEKRLKLQVKTIPQAEQEKLGLDGHGVLVEKVEPGVAFDAGIRSGDVLLLLDNMKVESAEQFMQLAGDLKAGKSVPILIQRRGNPIFLALKVPQ
jgi:serine protease Do